MLVMQEQNFPPLCEKLQRELVTLESGPFVALEGEKVNVQRWLNGELRDKGSEGLEERFGRGEVLGILMSKVSFIHCFSSLGSWEHFPHSA